jgi:catechol 2,3-dioxygenase-like lactoylglutathione lyase family enzyme
MSAMAEHRLTPILPCNDLAESVAFYGRLGFQVDGDYGDYKILSDGRGGHLHLTTAVEGWLVRNQNPFGLYLYADDVDAVARAFGTDGLVHPPKDQPWGMYEFAASDPDGALVRVGRPSNGTAA